MTRIEIRDMQTDDEVFVGSCTHVNETDEWNEVCKKRIQWFHRAYEEKGLRIKVALVDGEHAGFIYLYPIEHCPWGPAGKDLMVITCLDSVKPKRGVGRALMDAAEKEAREQGKKGICVNGFYWKEMWFMPGEFFEKIGYEVVQKKGNSALFLKKFSEDAQLPQFLERKYVHKPVPGKVVVDLFCTDSCLTTCTEAERVRKVCAEFGDKVVLNQYDADDPEILKKYQVWRAIYVNGSEIHWGYEAPWEGIREAINKVMD
ncbi:GNAT family N-acetyltransferase [candidate division WOR-3 bacterium]|nr:GNAT family N-acetyltransferase [candidate division WOR-3 bacterium]